MESEHQQTNAVFYWASHMSEFRYTLDGVDKAYVLSFVGNANDAEEYVKLHTDDSEIHIRVEDFKARVTDSSLRAAFEADKLCDFFDFKLWDKNGALVGYRSDIFDSASKRRLPRFLEVLDKLNNEPDAILKYGQAWEEVLLRAVQHSKNLRPLSGGKFNAESRFFTVPEDFRPLKLIVVGAVGANWLDLQTLGDTVTTANANEPPECEFEVMTASALAARNDLILLSAHPLGFYSTYVTQLTLETLVDLQVGKFEGSWLRPLPSGDAILQFDDILSKAGYKFRNKLCQVSPDTNTVTFKYRGDTTDDLRTTTQAIMGDSANKWAKSNAVGWSGGEFVAEWLHRSAHRFDGSLADIFTNLIVGTVECNTHMIRAESTASQLLLSAKIVLVTISTKTTEQAEVYVLDRSGKKEKVDIPWHNTNPNFDRRFYWITPQLDYHISCTTYRDNPVTHEGSTTFYPFHRYTPLRYEFELDKLVTAAWLNTLPAKPADRF